MTLLMCTPPMSGVNMNWIWMLKIAFKGGLSDGTHPIIVIFMDPYFWKFFNLKKDINSESLRWFLRLQQFDLEVRDKG